VEEPFYLQEYINKNKDEINKSSHGWNLFRPERNSKGLHVKLYAPGTYNEIQGFCEDGERWIWQMSGSSVLKMSNRSVYYLCESNTKLIAEGNKVEEFTVKSGIIMSVYLPRRVKGY